MEEEEEEGGVECRSRIKVSDEEKKKKRFLGGSKSRILGSQ